MRYFTCLLVVLGISASTFYSAEANGQQLITSEKQQVAKQGTQNPEAYEWYLKGRSYYDKRTRADLETAISYFKQAVAKDPGYALGYAGLAFSYGRLPDFGASASENIPKSNAAALKAIELDPTLARPHVTLGSNKMVHEWDFTGGIAEFKKAVELDPSNADAHEVYAEELGLLGSREQEALAEIDRAHQLDPQSPAISVVLGNVHVDARRFDEAIAVCNKVANENPAFAGAHVCLATAYWGKKMYLQVLEEWKAYDQLSGDRDDAEVTSAMEQGFRSRGWKGALSKSIETLQAQRKTRPSSAYGSAYRIAEAYAELDDKDQAFQWFNTAFQEHDEGLVALKTDFALDPIRYDPRFAELVRKVGLPPDDASESQQVSKHGTQNPEAHELYLKGRACWDTRTLSGLEAAVSYFNQALAKDPGYVKAYEGLADAYVLLPEYGGTASENIPKANAAARKALELDANSGHPHAILGHIKFVHEWDFAGAEAEFRKAIELDPNDATAHQWYSEGLFLLGGREQEALAEITRAHQLDPQSLIITRDFGYDHTFLRQYDEAIVICQKLADESPDFYMAHYCLSDAYWRKRMYSQSIEEFRVASHVSGDRNDSELASAMDQGFRSGGWEGAYRKGIEVSLAQRKTGDSSPYTLATMYAELGEKDHAFQWLNTAFQEHDQDLPGLRTEPSFDAISSDPRFAELVQRMGLPPNGHQLSADETLWPTKGWATASPADVGVDEQALLRLDKEMASGKYLLTDSFAVFRCSRKVFEHFYPHDYSKVYAKEVKERGPYNMRLTGRYNYFDPEWHPYYHGSDLHTMQSVSKTITSVIIGAAIQRGDFKAGLDTPVLKYFDASKVKNVDDRKQRITLRDLLTMSSGLAWDDEDWLKGDPQSDTSRMEGSDDWVQYVIDKPMAAEPGKVWEYSDGGAELLAYIFQKETGQDIDDYGQKYLFAPLGIRHEWKRTYLGVADTEGGVYLTGSDLAKIGYLFLQDGMWNGQRIVSSEWVKASLTPYFQADEPQMANDKIVGYLRFKYGFLWWLSPLPNSTELAWMARGMGGQTLLVFPNEQLIVTHTGWDILPSSPGVEPRASDFLPLAKAKTCSIVELPQ